MFDIEPGYLLNRTTKAIRKAFSEELEQAGCGLTPEQFGVLQLIIEDPGSGQSEIRGWARKDKTRVTRLLNDLTVRGLVFRETDRNDRRHSNLYPTDLGKVVYKHALNVRQSLHTKLTAGISAEALQTVRKTLEHMIYNLK